MQIHAAGTKEPFIYRIISNGVVFKVQQRICWMWLTLGLYKTIPEAEGQIKTLLHQDQAKGKGRYMVIGVYNLKSQSDRGEIPTNAERLLLDK